MFYLMIIKIKLLPWWLYIKWYKYIINFYLSIIYVEKKTNVNNDKYICKSIPCAIIRKEKELLSIWKGEHSQSVA